MRQTLLDTTIPAPATPAPATPAPSDRFHQGGLPVGRTSQLALLQAQLEHCEAVVQSARRQAVGAMRDGEAEERERWAAVGRLRTLAWKAVREVLPLVDRVPPSLRGESGFHECRRAAHVLRRSAEAALRDNANFTVDLLAASQAPPPRSWS